MMNDREIINELCDICMIQSTIIKAQTDALAQVGAYIMEDEKAQACERLAALIDSDKPPEEEGGVAL